MAPWPGAGTNSSGSSTSVASPRRPSRSRPAAARTIASQLPWRSLRIRVSTLPRRSWSTRSGRSAATWARRRRLVVPTREPAGSLLSSRPALERRASRGSARSSTAQRRRPGGRAVGTSLRLWTARSISPASMASSISLRKAPLPPTASRRRSWTRSPVVVIRWIVAWWPRPASRPWTCSACHRASALPRDPIRISIETGSSAQGPQRARRERKTNHALIPLRSPRSKAQELADESHLLRGAPVAGDLLELDGGRVEELVDDGGGGGLEGGLLLRAERAQPPPGAVQLAAADVVRALAQLHEQRDHVERLLPFQELPDLALDQALGGRGLLLPLAQVGLGHRAQVVEVVEEDAFQLAGRRVDVARHRDVDEEQRPEVAAAPGRPDVLDVLAADDDAGSAGAADDDVGGGQLAAERFEGRRAAAQGRRQLLGP